MPKRSPDLLEKKHVAEAALRLAKRDGARSLSIASVARQLKVSPAAVKRHAASRAALLALVRSSLLESVPGLAKRSKRSKPRPRASGLTEAQIVEVALELVRQEGADALSMRSVARRLNASVMSLYHHVPSKEALLEKLWTAVLSSTPIPKPDAAHWEAELREYAVAGVLAMARYPGLLKYGMSRTPTQLDMQFHAHVTNVLLAAGLERRTAALGAITLHMCTLGTVLATDRSTPIVTRAPRDEDLRSFVDFATRMIATGLREEVRAAAAAKASRKTLS